MEFSYRTTRLDVSWTCVGGHVAGSAADGGLLDEPLGVVSEEDGAGAAAAADGVEAERDGRRA